ncbi:MAG: HEAT repeat domain-containing protein [Armatimonadota bacterium]
MRFVQVFFRLTCCLMLFCAFPPFLPAQPEIVPPPISQETNIHRLVECLRNPILRRESVNRLRSLLRQHADAPGSLELLLVALHDDDPVMRALVAELLAYPGITKDRMRLVDALLPVMRDAEATVRVQAINTLVGFWRGYRPAATAESTDAAVKAGLAPDPRVVTQWVAALQDPNADVRRSAAAALVVIGDARGVEPVLVLLNVSDTAQRLQLLAMLHRVTEDRVVAAIIPLLSDPVAGNAAAHALVDVRDPIDVDSLLAVQQGQDAPTRRRVVTMLSRINSPQATDAFLAFLQDADAGVRDIALQTLVNRRDPRVTDALLQMVKNPEPQQRLAAVQLLPRVKDPRVPDVLAALIADANASVSRGAALALAQLGDPRALDSLAAMLKDNNPHLRRTAVSVLGKINDPRAVDLLLSSVQDTDKSVRISAMQSLRASKDARVVEAIARRLTLGDRQEKMIAIQTLRDLRNASAVPYLLTALKDDDAQIRQSAGQALQAITGKNFGLDAAKWQAWWDARGK